MNNLAMANDQADKVAASGTTGQGQRAQVLYGYAAEEDNELSLVEDEILTDVEQIDEGWWTAKGQKGHGMFPAK